MNISQCADRDVGRSAFLEGPSNIRRIHSVAAPVGRRLQFRPAKRERRTSKTMGSHRPIRVDCTVIGYFVISIFAKL